jgi:RNA polymerase-interacting CarD/CdnL/TRCF family regulator
LFVPVEKANASGLRLLLSRSEIPQLLNHLQQPAGAAKDWKQRAHDNSKRLASGSAFDLAEVVKSLTELSETKELSFPESRTLDKARRLLVGEIAEVLRETKSAVEELIDQALKAREIAGD